MLLIRIVIRCKTMETNLFDNQNTDCVLKAFLQSLARRELELIRDWPLRWRQPICLPLPTLQRWMRTERR